MEMLIVIAIIGILAAVMAPSLSDYMPGVQLNGSARVLSGNLRETQEKAVTEQQKYLIRFFPNESPAYYQTITIVGNEPEVVIKKVNLPTSVAITIGTGIIDNQISFSPDGGPSSSGDITLSINGSQKVINVSPAGFIKIK